MANKLTSKEDRFCTLVAVEGLSQRQAYRRAYTSHASDKAADVSASRLANKAKIRLRLEELRAIVISPAIADRDERLRMWSEMARDNDLKPIDRLRASELLAKAEGDFIQRVETTGVTATVALSEYSTEDLRLMLSYMRENRNS